MTQQDIWQAACRAQLKAISETFLSEENLNKADTLNDKVVLQAIGETIQNFPLVEYKQFTPPIEEGTWIKASERLPIHLAYWNIEDGIKKDCTFPVRIGRVYGMGELFDERLVNDELPKYSITINGKQHFEDQFSEIEWLDEKLPSSPNKEGERKAAAEAWEACRQYMLDLKEWPEFEITAPDLETYLNKTFGETK